MEDFASVIWAVIIVGAMIFNVVSQSHKARGKGTKQTPHDEAWPSPASDMPEPPATPARPASPTTPTARPKPFTPVFQDEWQSLEEIPAQEYTPEYTAPEMAETAAFRDHNMPKTAGHSRHRAAGRSTAPEKETIAAQVITDTPEDAKSIAEVFDLRRAVIYSEILKPRFDEE